jgi:hypothetical protein
LSSLESRREADRAAKYANPNPEEPPPKGVKVMEKLKIQPRVPKGQPHESEEPAEETRSAA